MGKDRGETNRDLDDRDVRWFRRQLTRWHVANARGFPWRETKNPYKILIAEILLQATFAAKVVPVYEELVARYPMPIDLARASISEIEDIIRPLGLLSRARVLSDIGESLVTRFDGVVPSGDEELRSLPRVGDYTAGAVQSFGFGRRAGIPDTNIIRLLQRFFGLHSPRKSHRGSPPKAIRIAAIDVLPETDSRELNYAMLDFGALVCKSVRPKCRECPLSKSCHAYGAGEVTPA